MASQGNKRYAIFTFKNGLFDWNETNGIVGLSVSNTVLQTFNYQDWFRQILAALIDQIQIGTKLPM